jgi:hypothetical protein
MTDRNYMELRQLSPKVTGGLIRMRAETFRDAVVPAKYKILAAMLSWLSLNANLASRATPRWRFRPAQQKKNSWSF